MKDQIEAFVVDATSGVIRTAAPLDRESIPLYEIYALAIDRGSPPLSSSVSALEYSNQLLDSVSAFHINKRWFVALGVGDHTY